MLDQLPKFTISKTFQTATLQRKLYTMVTTVASATAANRKATTRLKVAASQLERHIPPQDELEADVTQVSEAPSTKPRPRQSSVAACVPCATALEAMEAGQRAGHICTHLQVEQEEDEVSVAGSEAPVDPPRGGKHKQPDEFVVRQYMDVMDEKLDALVQAVAILGPLLDEDSEKNYENHLLQWSGYCEGLKERARELIALIRAGNGSQVEKDRLFALNLAGQEGQGGGHSGDVDGDQVEEEQQSHLHGSSRVTPSPSSRPHRA